MRERIVDYEMHHYHQPSDEIQPTWNYAGMIQDAQLGFAVGATIAGGGDAPAFVAGDEFARARK
jgi:hypothetical protein